MKALAVDLRTVARPPAWAWVGLGLLGVIAVALVGATGFATKRLAERNADVNELRGLETAPASRPAPLPRKLPYDDSAREFLTQATSQWPAMLVALESIEIVGVTPVSIEVSPSERSIRLEVEFADYSTLLKYVDGLNAGENSPRWVLVQAQASSRSSTAVSGQPSVAFVRASI